MRKVYVTIETTVLIEMYEGIELEDVINEMEYEFVSTIEGTDVLDAEITDYFIEDSK